MKQAVLIPLDNRPVTYVFPQLIAKIAGVQATVPPRNLMGSLSSDTHVDALTDWLVSSLKTGKPDAALVCADSIIYGGLIRSRRSDETAADLLKRAKPLEQLKGLNKSLSKVFVQSSIMRVSDNYDNTEEKEYWSKYGREIFAWSEALHQMQSTGTKHGDQNDPSQLERLKELESKIDTATREDYLATRRRNFQVNKKLIDYAASGKIDVLIFSQDDSGQFGLNVMEKERLIADAKLKNLKNVLAYAGADEVLCAMLSRWLVSLCPYPPRVSVSFSDPNGSTINSRYEGQTIGESVANQLLACGLTATTPDINAAELRIVVHTGGNEQGDHIWLPGLPDGRRVSTEQQIEETIKLITAASTPVILCDLAYANGADPALLDALLDKPEALSKVCAFGGWNTTGNTLGSALATGVARWYADWSKAERADDNMRDALFVRLADDWAYQAHVRQELGGKPCNGAQLEKLMAPYLERISKALNHSPSVNLSLPWERTFEIEIDLSGQLQATGQR